MSELYEKQAREYLQMIKDNPGIVYQLCLVHTPRPRGGWVSKLYNHRHDSLVRIGDDVAHDQLVLERFLEPEFTPEILEYRRSGKYFEFDQMQEMIQDRFLIKRNYRGVKETGFTIEAVRPNSQHWLPIGLGKA